MLVMRFAFFFNDTATTEIYTLSLHDALPISAVRQPRRAGLPRGAGAAGAGAGRAPRRGNVAGARLRRWRRDRKSKPLKSSHANISYAVLCLEKKTLKTEIGCIEKRVDLQYDR